MDMYLLGETIFNGENCKDTIVDNNLHFLSGSDHSQLVIGESALTCMANQWAKSPIGKLHLNEHQFNELFKLKGDKIATDSTSIKNHIKIFEEKLGKNVDLDFSVDFKNINIELGKYEVDLIANYEMCVKFQMHKNKKELMYDCFAFTSAANIHNRDQILHIDLMEHRLNLNGETANREAPKRNNMDLTTNEYREFLEDISFTVSEAKTWLNDVVLRGNKVRFPYAVEEFKTTLKFEAQKMHLMLDIEDKAYRFLEEEFWNDDFAKIDQ